MAVGDVPFVDNDVVCAALPPIFVQDVGGEEKLRPYWRHYYTGTQGVLFVVDGADRERLAVASLELRSMANDEQLAAAAVAVVVNRRKGAAAAIPADEIKATLGLDA